MATPDESLDDTGDSSSMSEEDVGAPWHFWVMIVGVVIYLGWRLVEAIIWGADRLF